MDELIALDKWDITLPEDDLPSPLRKKQRISLRMPTMVDNRGHSGLSSEDMVAILEESESKPRVFVETGTYRGETILRASKIFTQCFTIEKSHAILQEAYTFLATQGATNVTMAEGDSGEILTKMCPVIEEPVFFWLDAHFMGVDGQTPKENPPLMMEIAAIARRKQADVVVIDDVRCFGTQDWQWGDWGHITLDKVLQGLSLDRIRKQYIKEDRLIVHRMGA